MASRTMKDVIKALQAQFSAAKIPISLPTESRRMLQNFVDEHDGTISEEESARVSTDLWNFWERYVGETPAKTGAFIGVLKELQPLITRDEDTLFWWNQVVRGVVTSTGYRKAVLDDGTEFVVQSLLPQEGAAEGVHSRVANRLLGELFSVYATRTRSLVGESTFVAGENAQVAQQIEGILVAFGKKQPKDLFYCLDRLIVGIDTRMQGLTLLGVFLRQQTPHLYLASTTPLVETLLKCLMSDTSTTVLSVALTSLTMLLPHIAASLSSQLPRLFLVYSRLLCWEKFSPLSTEAQKLSVTDDRISTSGGDPGDVGIDADWEKLRPADATTESEAPELLTFFTYLYGLYPLHLTSYIRKPRRFLKDRQFPGADDFDLDQTVIRSRTEQFRQLHLLHPNFYNMTVEEEANDPKWAKMESADVVAEVHALCVANVAPVSPGPPPSSKLPDVPRLPAISTLKSPQLSPSTSHASFKTGNSWRDTQSTSGQTLDGDSPVLGPHSVQSDDDLSIPAFRPRSKGTSRATPSLDDFPRPARSPKTDMRPPQSNIAYVERENTLLRNELNFERWHKAQYSAHIGQLMRKNVKDAATDAQQLNLLNANRALHKQNDHIRSEREATIKDSALTRKHSNSLEASYADRFTQMKKDQETWKADAQELRRLRHENDQYRELLVATEAREANSKDRLAIAKRDLQDMEDVQQKLDSAEDKVREYEYREFEMDRAKHELDIVLSEKDTLQMRVKRHQHELERAKQAHAEKVAELQACIDSQNGIPRRMPYPTPGPDTQVLIQQAVAETQSKLNQLRRKHTALMERYSDLELEHETIKSQLDVMQGRTGRNGTYFLQDTDNESHSHSSRDISMSGAGMTLADHGFDINSDLQPISENAYMTSTSEPTNRRFNSQLTVMPISPPRSEATLHNSAGLTWKPPVSRQDSLASRSSGVPATTFNQTAPLKHDEGSSAQSAFSDASGGGGQKKREKIKPNSDVRVYGRGGAQNIKLKSKDKDAAEKSEKSRGFGRLKNLV
ncbi:hypothetical protein LTR78_002198 [Recurvomyces mirabilis]|uniref:Hamartin n=1 Tax=Recurvomyces mirabilis TaxID=574656 RepID=A0AAE0WUM2_9PEZI|nr:hypothetical protein LTR78_002198 [Recurvomyces mirabilis]KAK5160654.1 hypothetical protein LTS14_001666 [Recurvomyces mirabilis]